MYALVVQESRVNLGLQAARVRLYKKGLTIPRLELAVELFANVALALDGFPLTEKYCWIDSCCPTLDQISRNI